MERTVIDESWVKIQEGLYLESYERINSLTGLTMVVRILHSAEGYCFYDLADAYYDEDGNQIPESEVTPEMRIYYQYMAIAENKDINDLVSVPAQPEYEIANRYNDIATA